MILQPINDLAEICARKGIKEAILCPGSRCAPLTIAFARHPEIRTRTITDERSAAFIALGIAQQTRKPVVLICTSGTAAYNFAPAVAEAYYQQIPLLVLTADRPLEWIDQQDGQAIRQQNIYSSHVKRSYQFPVDIKAEASAWHANLISNEAINLALAYPAGPVHVNIPLREPFYPSPGEQFVYSESVRIIEQIQPEYTIDPAAIDELKKRLQNHSKVMVIAGLHIPDPALKQALQTAKSHCDFVFLPDFTANLNLGSASIAQPEKILSRLTELEKEEYKPDVLITFGGPILSKTLKNFLRSHQPNMHWHLQTAGDSPDTFQCLTHTIPVTPAYFFSDIWPAIAKPSSLLSAYSGFWKAKEMAAQKQVQNYLSSIPYGEFAAVKAIIDSLPENSILQVGNSMPVRYASIVGINPDSGIEVYANRGTSGIDGSLSTALGCALATHKLVMVLLGDLSFFYDRNGLWHNYLPKNLRIIVLNNFGGGIFDIIEGPANQPEAEEYFTTQQRLTAQHAAAEAGLPYFCATYSESLKLGIQQLFHSDGPALLEVQSDRKTNTQIFKQYQQGKSHESTSVDPS